MQERYLGDVHDFYKFRFLKFLSKFFCFEIGLNWYLVNPKNISLFELEKHDGEKRTYLEKSNFYEEDRELIEELLELKLPEKRRITDFTKNSHLKKYINFFNTELRVEDRSNWFQQSVKYFNKNRIVFLDPDNGISKKKQASRRSIKYVLDSEIKQYLEHGKTIIFTQFQSFNKPHRVYINEIISFLKDKKILIELPIIRNRTSPNTFYFTVLGSEDSKVKFTNVYENYVKTFNDSTELITF